MQIAYWALGSGPVLVHCPLSPNDLLAEWQVPEWRAWYEGLAEHHRVVKFDRRGSGRSQRDVSDLSPEALVGDLAAIVDASGMDAVDLLGVYSSGPSAITYATRHPERLRHLVLLNTYANGADVLENDPRLRAIAPSALEHDFDAAAELFVAAVLGVGHPRAEQLIPHPNEWSSPLPASRCSDLWPGATARSFGCRTSLTVCPTRWGSPRSNIHAAQAQHVRRGVASGR